MRFLAVAALLTFGGFVTAPPPLSRNTSTAEEATVGDINDWDPRNSCILVLSGDALHCAEDLDHDSDSAVFPNDEQLKPYVDYRNCLLGGELDCEEPESLETLEAINAVVGAKNINALIEGFDETHSDSEGVRKVLVAHSGSGLGAFTAKANVQNVSPMNTSECCLKNCAFTFWWGPIAYGFCLAMCTCP